jgi:hypothetical protein
MLTLYWGTRNVDLTMLWSSANGQAWIESEASEASEARFITAVFYRYERGYRLPLPPQAQQAAW